MVDSRRNDNHYQSGQRNQIQNLDIEDDCYDFWGAERYDREVLCMPDRYQEAHTLQNSIVCNALESYSVQGP
jgi:hypothetical protein